MQLTYGVLLLARLPPTVRHRPVPDSAEGTLSRVNSATLMSPHQWVAAVRQRAVFYNSFSVFRLR